MSTATHSRFEIMLEGLIDYAGLFPPATLSMEVVVENWSTYLQSSDAWMLGRLIIPASRLSEFKTAAARFLPSEGEDSWQLTALLPHAGTEGFSEVVQQVVAFNETDCGAVANSVEFKASTTSEIDAALSVLHDDLFPFIELPIGQDPRGLLAALAGSIAGAKVRTGGVSPEMYPSVHDLARFIHSCAVANQQFKATAGLHHPSRNHNPAIGTGVYEFGFLAVLHAAAAARFNEATVEQVAQILQAETVDLELCGEEMLEKTRAELFCSFGSCSFDDPRRDLQAMNLLKESV